MNPEIVFTKSELPALLREQEVYTCFASSDFLGFSKDSRILQSVRDGLNREKEFGIGCAKNFGLSSNQILLEQKISSFRSNEETIVFSSFEEFLLSFIQSLNKTLTPVYLSKNLSSKILDIFALSSLEPIFFDSKKPDEFEEILLKQKTIPLQGSLESSPLSVKPLVVVESVTPFDGEIVPLRSYHKITEKLGAELLVDESFATGVLGLIGSGGLEFSALLDFKISSFFDFSHTASFRGAAISARAEFLDTYFYKIERDSISSPLIYGIQESLNLIQVETKKRNKLKANSLLLREGLFSMGLKVKGDPGIPIVFLPTPDSKILAKFYQGLTERKILVCKEECREESGLRIFLTALHTPPLIANLLQAVEDISKQLGLLRN